MSDEVIIDDLGRTAWEKYARAFADYSIYQTWAYQEVRAERHGQELSRAVVKNESNEVVAMCHVRIKHIRSLGLRIGYVQQGPLVRAADGGISCSAEALKALREAYLDSKVSVLRVVPNVLDDETGRRVSQMLKSSGFEPVSSIRPYLTLILQLDGSKEDIRSRLDRNFRRNLKKAEKAGIETREGHSREFCEILRELYVGLVQRKGFKALDPDEFIGPQLRLSPAEQMHFVAAYRDGEPVSVHLASNLGATGVALLVATNEEGLSCGSSYLVWWKACMAAKDAGMERYDLGGVDRDKNPGSYRFKSQISKQEYMGIGAFEACNSLSVRTVWHACEKAYNLFKG